ncbi:MAG: ABC transporter permease [Rhodopirellula sp.]|nr:ABC transporter permease [Rhodopirellula sp.]
MSQTAVSASTSPRRSPPAWLAVWTLSHREITRFLRQRSRLVGALATPVMFWVLFGAGLHDSFQTPEWMSGTMSYRAYFLPGITALILMFTAIFSAMSIIEDRHEGFLQGVLVSPVSRSSLVLGKVAGGVVMAVVQALMFVGLGWLMGRVGLADDLVFEMGVMQLALLTLFMAVVAFGLTSLGFMLAWKLDSIQGFHAIMNVFLMPMWLLSGAFFPASQTGALSWIMKLNPLSYGVAGIRRLLYDSVSMESANETVAGPPSLGMCFLMSAVFAGLCFQGAVWQARRDRVSVKRDRSRRRTVEASESHNS